MFMSHTFSYLAYINVVCNKLKSQAADMFSVFLILYSFFASDPINRIH